jgi:Ca2+-binding RTX toxin-like protein
MQKGIASGLTAMGVAAAIVLPSACAAQSRSYRDDRADRPALSINQSVDRADARIAALKADLRLSDDQAKNWPGLESALHDIAAKRAKSLSGESDPQTGRSASETPAADHPVVGEDADVTARREQAARSSPQSDDITAMQREADALAAQSANLRQISSAGKPLYDSLDDRQRQRFVRFVKDDIRMNERDDSHSRYR